VAIDENEIVGIGKDFVPDALEVNVHGLQPAANLPPDPLGPEIDLDNDEDAIAATGASTAKPSS
jgi:hypothetical protein